jgi:hypothetical protein
LEKEGGRENMQTKVEVGGNSLSAFARPGKWAFYTTGKRLEQSGHLLSPLSDKRRKQANGAETKG